MSKPNPLPRITLYDPSGRGGIAQYTYFLAESLTRAGCRVTLLTSHDYELRDLPRQFDLVELFKPSWIRTVVSTLRGMGTPRPGAPNRESFTGRPPAGPKGRPRLGWLRRARLRLLLLSAVARILATRSRILHVQWCIDRAEETRFLRLLKRLGVRTLYTAHDLLPHEGEDSGDREAFTELYQAVDQVVVFADSTRRELVDTFGLAADRVSVIPHGSDVVASTPSQDTARRRLGIGADRRVILFFGAIKPYKGLEYLVQAFDRVRGRVDGVLLLVAGGGAGSLPSEADYYDSLVAELRARRDVVTALEYVPFSDLGIYFSAADLVVLPYVRTSHSGVLLTAYATGKPVIVTDTGALAEAVEEGRTGFVVPPGDVDALANRMEAVLTLPDRGKSMGQRSLELSRTVYSWTAVGEQTAALYRRLLERGEAVGRNEEKGADTSVASRNAGVPSRTDAEPVEMPKVSVVVPTHNRAGLLRRAIQSVLDQTFQGFEILVVDDASDDDTEAVVRGFDDRRIQHIRHATSKGDAGARNAGVRAARGEYLAFLDDDDEWLPEKLRLQLEFLEASGPECGGVHTARWTVHVATGKQSLLTVAARQAEDLRTNWITTSSMLLRKRCFESVGTFDETMPTSSDYDLWIRFAERFRLGYIRVPLVKYYVHGDGLTGDLAKMIRGQEMLLAKHRAFFATSTTDDSRKHLSLGTLYCYAGDARKARAAFRRAARINPWAIRNYFNLGLSLLGPANFKKFKALRDRLDSNS